uniref:Serine carboxypeptidase-like 19 n=1 Tax=Aegilops tauschii subsp. strangulata TaxID=200361 RepID=A0A453FQN3_AEGTS
DSKLVTSLPGFDGRLPFRLHTGYVEVDPGTELFYYFVESEAGGEGNPFLLWLTGGDRCSAFSGLAYEIGPVRFVLQPYNGSLPRLHINPNSWTKVAHILFVDSPVGAGFSFSKQPKGYEVGDVSSSLQLHNFLIKWFSDHPTYLKNPFYIGGDSYAGKLVPYIAHIISQEVLKQEIVPTLILRYHNDIIIAGCFSDNTKYHKSLSYTPSVSNYSSLKWMYLELKYI